MASQTRRITLAAPQRTHAWVVVGVHPPGTYTDNRKATIVFGGERSDGRTGCVQVSLTLADVRALLGALEWQLAELKQQARATTAETVPWAGKEHPPKLAHIAKCGKCQRPIAFADDAELVAAGWQHPNTSARWVCPACKVDNG
jgi:hypothetical protein